MRQISIKQFLASRPACSIPLGLEFKRWFDAPLSARQSDIITLLEYHRIEKKRAPYLIVHDPHNREDVKEIIEAYLQWRNEMTAPGLRAALVTPKRFETNFRVQEPRRGDRVINPGWSESVSERNPGPRKATSLPKSPGGAMSPRARAGLSQVKVKHFTARSYRAAHGQTFGMVAALNCHQFLPKRKPEDGFADFPSVFIAMLDRTSPHHLLILHGCIPQGSNHSFARFMQRAAAQNAPYLIYDCVSRSFLTPESPRPQIFEKASEIHLAHSGPNAVRTSARRSLSSSEILAKPRRGDGVSNPWRKPEDIPARPPSAGVRECRPRRPKPNCPARGRENALMP